jgi:hypothetical protein
MDTTIDWLESLGTADLVLTAILVVVAGVVARAVVRRHPERSRQVLVAVFAAYVVAVLVLEFCPLPSLTPPHAAYVGTPPPGWLDRPPTPPSVSFALTPPGHLLSPENQDLMNVVLTVPLGLLLPMVSRWRPALLVLAVVAAPVFFETAQYVISVGVGYDWRAFDLQDLLTKTLGGLLGLAASAVARRSPRQTMSGALTRASSAS